MASLAFFGTAYAQDAPDTTGTTDVGAFLNNLYVFGLGVVALSSLIMLTVGGMIYMTAGDSQDRVGKGKTYMQNALWGLVVALLSWLILFTINPDLVKRFNFDNIQSIQNAPAAPATTPTFSPGVQQEVQRIIQQRSGDNYHFSRQQEPHNISVGDFINTATYQEWNSECKNLSGRNLEYQTVSGINVWFCRR